ncbi:adenine phosphoribosyltransferase [Pseudoxanthomonas sp.]|uniref:adenine phosphoribosyltransferase n=1 Tax=Pseudoxanthomonas sp. TaxID=1871049 RepID=UPI003F802A81
MSAKDEAAGLINALTRHVDDFPIPGVGFKDLTPVLADPRGLAMSIELLSNPFRGKGVDIVVGAESRGFIFGTAVACAISAGFQVVRKPKKLPWKTVARTYELEYGTDTLEMHEDAVLPGQRVVIVDDVLATGGTLRAAVALARRQGAQVIGAAVLVELAFLGARERWDDPVPLVATLAF